MVGRVEAHLADVAGVGPFARMDAHVLGQRVRFREGGRAHRARVRPQAQVRLQVRLERAAAHEPAGTLGTRVRLRARVP